MGHTPFTQPQALEKHCAHAARSPARSCSAHAMSATSQDSELLPDLQARPVTAADVPSAIALYERHIRSQWGSILAAAATTPSILVSHQW
jgi:hypothetical protein